MAIGLTAARAGGAPADALEGIADLRIVERGGASWLMALGRAPGSLSAFALGPATLDFAAQVAVPQMLWPTGGRIAELTLGGQDRLVLAGASGPALSWAFDESGFGGASTLPPLSAGGLGRIVAAPGGSGDWAWASALAGGGLTTIGTGGTQPAAGAVLADSPVTFLAGIADLASLRSGGGDWLVAASGAEDGVSTFRIGAGGTLTAGANLGARDGFGIAGPTALAVADAAQGARVILADAGTGSLGVLRLMADGRPCAVDQVSDSLTTRFADVAALATATVAGRCFVVAGGSDGGVSVFLLLPDDRLHLVATVEDRADLSLASVTALAATACGSGLTILAGSGSEAGLTRIDLALGDAGAVLRGTAAADTLAGGARDDILSGGDGDDSLAGGDGDDLLIDGAGTDRLAGGAGADCFILRPDGASDRIEDFDPAQDRIDLSAFPMLYSRTQLVLTEVAGMVEIGFAGETLTVAGSVPLTAAMFTDARLFNLPRGAAALPTGQVRDGGMGADTLTGTALADLLQGLAGNDLILGAGGADTLRGMAGADTVEGGEGADRLFGGLDGDDLAGGAGDDYLAGEDGADRLAADGGADTLWGGAGADTARGGDGEDELWGESGDDDLSGGGGADSLWGGIGNDRLSGDDDAGTGAADQLLGGDGSDTLDGGGGDDLLGGGTGADLLDGGEGADLLYGMAGRDTITGGSGDDLASGGSEDDQIAGGAGADTLWGDAGNDDLRGEDGNDRLRGGDGADLMQGGNDADSLTGDGGADTLDGGEGADTLLAGSGDDLLRGGGGADIALGEAGDDRVEGGGGDDQINGGDGADLLSGEDGNDTLWGAAGADRLDGGAGADRIYGGDGADTLCGGAGSDTLIGQAGADVFIFASGGGQDALPDFDPRVAGERIDLTGFALAGGWAGLAGHMAAAGGGTLISFDDGSSLLLANAGPGLLSADDFLF